MSDQPTITRRGILQVGVGAALGLAARRVAADPPRDCKEITPPQVEGPFYPTSDRADEDMDLTRIKGRVQRAAGDVIYVRGRVLDENCQPIQGVVVEIWQANQAGRYDHERDATNPAALDPNFQGWGEIVTGADGRFGFKTIKPGSYPADDQGWIRPPHVHFKVSRRGYHELITQMYFAGEPLNEPDLLRKELSPADKARLTVAFEPAPADLEAGARLGTFDITLRRVG